MFLEEISVYLPVKEWRRTQFRLDFTVRGWSSSCLEGCRSRKWRLRWVGRHASPWTLLFRSGCCRASSICSSHFRVAFHRGKECCRLMHSSWLKWRRISLHEVRFFDLYLIIYSTCTHTHTHTHTHRDMFKMLMILSCLAVPTSTLPHVPVQPAVPIPIHCMPPSNL